MSNHNYTPTEALETLLRKLRERDESLAMAVRLAIDSGKDIPEEQQIGWKKVRRYRKTIPFTHEEALNLSLGVLKLRLHFPASRNCFPAGPTRFGETVDAAGGDG